MRTLSPLGTMTNDNEQPATMDRNGSDDVVVLSGGDNDRNPGVGGDPAGDGSSPSDDYIEAEVFIKGTKCNRCCWDVDLKKEAVQCFKCRNLFHGVCYKDSRDISSPSALSGTLIPAISNAGSYEKRFGRFLFMCDFCTQTFSSDNSTGPSTQFQKPTELDKKVDTLSNDVLAFKTQFSEAIASLKEMMTSLGKEPTSSEVSTPSATDAGVSSASDVLYADVVGCLPAQQTQQLLHIATDNIATLSEEEVKEKVGQVKQKVTKSLKDVPTNFVKSNHQKGLLTVAFPDAETREKGSQLIENLNLSASGFHAKHGKKMLPKLTISGIDSSIFDSIDSNMSIEDKRLHHKATIKNSIISKNDMIKRLTDTGHTLEVVYMKGSESSRIMAAIKVSPAIRTVIFQNQHGKLFVGNNCLPVEDRFFFKQCFHCQQLGHESVDCPKSAETPVCFYCMGSHQSKNCLKKKSRNEHCCAKCYHSKVPAEKNDFKSHNAADPECPVILREIQKVAGNTDILSKNVM